MIQEFESIKITFDLDDPEQAAAYSIIKSVKRGTKGKLISNALVRVLHDHNLGNVMNSPSIASHFLDLLLNTPLPATISQPVSIPVADNKKKPGRKPKKASQPAKASDVKKEIKEPATPAPILEEKEAEAPREMVSESVPVMTSDISSDSDYPWRLPNGRIKTLDTPTLEKMQQEDSEKLELYFKEMMDYWDEHPEERANLTEPL